MESIIVLTLATPFDPSASKILENGQSQVTLEFCFSVMSLSVVTRQQRSHNQNKVIQEGKRTIDLKRMTGVFWLRRRWLIRLMNHQGRVNFLACD